MITAACRRLTLLVVPVVATVCLAGCGGNDGSSPSQGTASMSLATTDPAELHDMADQEDSHDEEDDLLMRIISLRRGLSRPRRRPTDRG